MLPKKSKGKPYLKDHECCQLFVADAPVKKKIQKLSFTTFWWDQILVSTFLGYFFNGKFKYFVLKTLSQGLCFVIKLLKSTLGYYGKTGKTGITQKYLATKF